MLGRVGKDSEVMVKFYFNRRGLSLSKTFTIDGSASIVFGTPNNISLGPGAGKLQLHATASLKALDDQAHHHVPE